jgi:hypothetical protein
MCAHSVFHAQLAGDLLGSPWELNNYAGAFVPYTGQRFNAALMGLDKAAADRQT